MIVIILCGWNGRLLFNIPFNQICCDGKIINDKKLKDLLYKNKNIKKKKIVVLCGSGITACNIIFALQKINHKYSVSLYDGSWSEWGMMWKKTLGLFFLVLIQKNLMDL